MIFAFRLGHIERAHDLEHEIALLVRHVARVKEALPFGIELQPTASTSPKTNELGKPADANANGLHSSDRHTPSYPVRR